MAADKSTVLAQALLMAILIFYRSLAPGSKILQFFYLYFMF